MPSDTAATVENKFIYHEEPEKKKEQCPAQTNKERSAKQREGMFLDLVHWFLCTNIYGLSAGNKEKESRKEMQKRWLSTAKV